MINETSIVKTEISNTKENFKMPKLNFEKDKSPDKTI